MSDFEQDFRAKVQGGKDGPIGGVVPNNYVEKRPFDKRWFAIGGLIVALVATLIVLSVISRGGGGDVPGGDGGSVVGTWRCDDIYSFFEDGSFFVRSIDGSASSVGAYSYDGGVLVLEVGPQVTIGNLVSGSLLSEGEHRLSVAVGKTKMEIKSDGRTCERMGAND